MSEVDDLLKLLGVTSENEEAEIEQDEVQDEPTYGLSERDAFTPIRYGPRGVTWSAKPGVLGAEVDNPLMFTCSICLIEVEVRNWKDAHKKGCRNLLMNNLGL